ncbi:tetratricopeptide repeat-containing sensor histidine kinase [Aquimarina sp. M1]
MKPTIFIIIFFFFSALGIAFSQNELTSLEIDSLLKEQSKNRAISNKYYYSNFEESVKYEKRFLRISKLLGQKDSIAKSFYRVGVNEFYMGKTELAKTYTDSSIYIYKSIKDTVNLAHSYSLKSTIYSLIPDYEKTLINLNKTKDLLKNYSATDQEDLGKLYLNFGIYYYQLELYDKAIEECKKVLEIGKKISKDYLIQAAKNNLAFSYRLQGKIEASIKISNDFLNDGWEKNDANMEFLMAIYRNLAQCYLITDELDKALLYAKKTEEFYSMGDHNKIYFSEIYTVLGGIYLKKGEIKKARNYFNKSYKISKEINSIGQMISSLEGLINLNKSKDQKQAIIFLEEITNLKDSILNLESLSRIEGIEINRAVVEKDKIIQEVKNESIISENNIRKLYSRYIYLILFFLLLVISIFIFLYQRNRIANAENNQRIAENKLYALRSHMNPHYIFNMLNSVQDFVLSSDKFAAYDYLSKFAKSVRLVLDNADSSVASIENELEVIRLYVELQQIRFPDRIELIKKIDLSDSDLKLKIPSMILQPIVENSIVHGLLNKIEGGKVIINLKVNNNKDILECDITDTGIGRLAAQKRKRIEKKKSITEHNTKERIEIFRKLFNRDFSYKIIDLLDDNDQSIGTVVYLKIPIIRKV